MPLPTPARYGLAAVCGAIYGVIVSWIVNCTLVEISVNTFFAVVSRNKLISIIDACCGGGGDEDS